MKRYMYICDKCHKAEENATGYLPTGWDEARIEIGYDRNMSKSFLFCSECTEEIFGAELAEKVRRRIAAYGEGDTVANKLMEAIYEIAANAAQGGR